ncbi:MULTISPECIES: putative minor capsid protein [Bacillaceae]|uniref:putative minor capsid protein n=1 Tax=Bacillaceae TaxID=186817 RepID=UPI0013D02700|nr:MULTISPECIES: putative minor capsid protein [Bacillaceae]MCM3404254.1 minor capsid protein [Cytobacillus oceanisediminis]MCU1804758.1 minor capsid protein [Cytobacillus firmus]
MVKPIPKKVLIHFVTYEEYLGKGRMDEEYKQPITLSNVLVQPVSNIKRSNIAEQKAFQSLLFFDVVNSSSEALFEFKEKSKVTFQGQRMTVNKVNPVHAFSLHHYEVELV